MHVGIERVLLQQGDCSFGATALDLLPAHHRFGELERMVLYTFGVNAAVRGEVDVLEENPEEGRGNGRAGFVYLHGDDTVLCSSGLRPNRNQKLANERRHCDYITEFSVYGQSAMICDCAGVWLKVRVKSVPEGHRSVSRWW